MTRSEFLVLNSNIVMNTSAIIRLGFMLSKTEEDKKRWDDFSKNFFKFQKEILGSDPTEPCDRFGGDNECHF